MTQDHEAAKWLFDFAYEDLDALPPADLSRVATGMLIQIAGINLSELEGAEARRIWEEFRAEAAAYIPGQEGLIRLTRIRAELRTFIDEMFRNLEERLRSGLVRRGWGHNLPTSLPLQDVSVNVSLGCVVDSNSSVEVAGDHSEHSWEQSDLDNSRISTRHKFSSEEEALKYQVLRSLDGMPFSSLRQCPECERWFVHLSKRRKIYCSNNCAARFGARERRARIRDEAPEIAAKERADARERAHDSYKREVRKKHPSARVARRPRNTE